MVNMLHRKKRVNDDFSVSKLEISMLQTIRNTENRPKSTKTWNCKHCWMKMIHKHKNNSQSNWALVNKLFHRLQEMGKIQKVGRWVPHELNERQMEKRKNTCEILLERYRRKSFLYRIIGDEKWIFFLDSQAQKIMGRPIHIDRKTESLWQEDDALCLVGPEGCSLLWVIEAWQNGWYQTLSTTIDRFELFAA